MLDIVRGLFAGASAPMDLGDTPSALGSKARLSPPPRPIRLDLGERALLLGVESQQGRGQGDEPASWMIRDAAPEGLPLQASIWLRPGQSILVGRDTAHVQRLFALPRSLPRRQLELRNERGDLVIRNLAPDHPVTLALGDAQVVTDRRARELSNLSRIRAIAGGSFTLLEPDDALAAVQGAIAALRTEPYRRTDSSGRPGGLVELPGTIVPVVLGDLHCALDNLLVVLCRDGLLDALERGSACLLLLGDTVHLEAEAHLDEMDSSLLMLDVLSRLKAHLPRSLFWLRGNHESFDDSVGKLGVPQGALLRRAAEERRGAAYASALEELFESLPYVAMSDDFVACHAGPPRAAVTPGDLVEIRSHPAIARELVWVRPRGRGQPAGFGGRDVSRLRAALGVGKESPLIVGHTPQSDDGVLWTDVAEIPNLHVIYDARAAGVPVFTRLRGGLAPLEFPTEALARLSKYTPPH